MRNSFLSVWVFLCGIFISSSVFAQSPTISPWQLHKGNEGVLDFQTYYNGDSRAYSLMNIPAKNDKGWETAPLDANNEVSIKWGSVLPCQRQIDFTYFQTIVNIPDNYTLKSANISYNKADDGARIYIFNSKYPSGIFDPQADISIHRKNTANVDFLDKFSKGENRIVIVQFDDCGDSNRLEGIKVTLNGDRIVPESKSKNYVEVMGINQTLQVGGAQLISKNGLYNLIVQPDGNFCIYKNKTTFVWCSMSHGKGGYRVTFNADGNLCQYNSSNQIVWETGTNKGSIREVGALLILDDQGVLKVMNANQEMLWSSTSGLIKTGTTVGTSNTGASVSNANNTLNLNQELKVSKYLVSNNGAYEFGLCGKGSLVLYKITNGKYSIDWFCGKSSGSRVKLEQNGNLVVYGANGSSIWSSNTADRGVFKAVMEDRGDLVLYGANGQVIWSCKTANTGSNTHPNPDNSRFAVGCSFKEGEEIATSNNNQYGFGIRQGSLRVYNRSTGQSVWSCGSNGGTRGSFESSGDIVLYDASGRALWRSNTGGKGCTRAALSDNGEIVMYTTSGQQVSSFAGVGSSISGSASGASKGLITNGTFDGSPSSYGWKVELSEIDYPQGGNPGGCMWLNNNGGATDPSISQVISGLTVGTWYKISGDYKGGKNVHLHYLDRSKNAFSVDIDGHSILKLPLPAALETWTRWECTFKAEKSSVTLRLRGEIDGTDGDVMLDNIKMEVTNGPIAQINCEAKNPLKRFQNNMKPGDKLQLNEKLVSTNGKYQFRITSDGNYVVEEVLSSGDCPYKEVYRFPIVNGGSRPAASYFSYNPDGNVCMESSQGKGFCLTDGRDNMVYILYKSKMLELTNEGKLVLVGHDNQTVWSSTPTSKVALPTYFKLHAYSIHGKRVEKGSDYYMGYTNGSADGKIINPNSGTIYHIEKVIIDASKDIYAFKVINAPQPNTYLNVFANKNVGMAVSPSGNSHHFYVKPPEESEAKNFNFASFESVAYPNWYLRHQGFILKISEGNAANRQDIVYRQDASWLFEELK